MMRGAFAQTLTARGIRRVPMLFQHDPSEPVGIWLELREDHRGLFARGRLIPEVARGRELLSLLRAGAIDGRRRGAVGADVPGASLLAAELPAHAAAGIQPTLF